MLKDFKKNIGTNLVNLQSWKTSRKIVVIESDDWGSIRMPSKGAYSKMLSFGIRVDKCPYNRFDRLESKSDLYALFDTLASVKDSMGNSAMLTANTIVANPDFEKIADSNFKEYYYEIFTDTYKKYYSSNDILDVISDGQASGLYHPQFHGREHLNVHYWMKALENNKEETRYAFTHKLFGISKNITTEARKSYLPAFDFEKESELETHKQIIIDGLDIFEKLFGFKSSSFVAPNYTWHPAVEKTLKNQGVEVIQGARAQQMPGEKGIRVKKKRMGSINEHGQVYLVRNVQFEPTSKPGLNWADRSFKEVSLAFLYRTPAVISTHRLNFMGGLDEQNRQQNLKLLKNLLQKILKKYPDTEFMTSDQLGRFILSKKANNGNQ